MKAIKGSVTLEAAIVLPVFISVVLSVVFLIKVVYVHEIMQHAIDQSAKEMAMYSYVYQISGLSGIQDATRDGLKNRSKIFEDHLSAVLDSYSSLKDLSNTADNVLVNNDSQTSTEETVKNAGKNFDSMLNAVDDAGKNPVDELKSIACMFASGAFEDLKTDLCIPLIRYYVKKYLGTQNIKDKDQFLKGLNVDNGFNGLDFSRSSFYEDADNDIDIVISYSLKIPVPFRIFPDFNVVQRASARAWLGGDKKPESGAGVEDEDIWGMKNFPRGKRFREIFGANLPLSFPVISRFDRDTGTACMIKSMDLTAVSYRNTDNIKKTMSDYIKNMAQYEGQEAPFGQKGIVIRQSRIKAKKIILVVPKNTINEETRKVLDDCRKNAGDRGVNLEIEEYGIKKSEDGP